MTALWLITSIALADPAAAGLDVDVHLSPPELGVAPAVSAIPPGMPAAQKAPLDGKWCGSGGDDRAGSYLPRPLDQHVLRRLRMLERYPEICQAHLDELDRVRKAELEGAVAVERAQCLSGQVTAVVDAEHGVPVWQVVAGAVVLSVIAGGFGYGLRALSQ